MKYEISTLHGYTVVVRNVLELDYDSTSRVVKMRLRREGWGSEFSYYVHGVTAIKGMGDHEPWEKSVDIIPPSGGAPASAGHVGGYAGGTTDAVPPSLFTRSECAVPAELATTTFAPLESLIAEGALTVYVPKSIPLENMA